MTQFQINDILIRISHSGVLNIENIEKLVFSRVRRWYQLSTDRIIIYRGKVYVPHEDLKCDQ